MKLTEDTLKTALEEVLDPEMNISIVDLGLVYKIEIKKERKVKITMTLTSLGCPLFSIIEQEIKSKLSDLDLKSKDIELNLVFDPPWSMEHMTERGKAMLGI